MLSPVMAPRVRVCSELELESWVTTSRTTSTPTPKPISWRRPTGREFSGMVSDLAANGVEFRVCNNALVSRNIDPDNCSWKQSSYLQV